MSTDLRPGPSSSDYHRAGRDHRIHLRRAARSRSVRPWPVWARLAVWLLGTLTLLLGMGAIGGLLVFAFEERPAGALVLAAAALGAVLANALRQAVGPRF